MRTAIHFLNVGDGDCILLENNGLFGLIDTGETATHPQRGEQDYGNPYISTGNGYTHKVISYIGKVFRQSYPQQVPSLQFIIATHSHSDHIGSIADILVNSGFIVNALYANPYSHPANLLSSSRIPSCDRRFDNQFQYDRMHQHALWYKKTRNAGFQYITDLFNYRFIPLGDMSLELLNSVPSPQYDENMNSIVIKLRYWGCVAALMGDFQNDQNSTEREDNIKEKIGRVNILKLAHHGLSYSSSPGFLQHLNPDIAINSGARSNLESNKYKPLKVLDNLNTDVYCTTETDEALVIELKKKVVTATKVCMDINGSYIMA